MSNLCRSCGESFGSVSAFDAHRVGVHEYTLSEGLRMEPPREDGRRCLSVREMTEQSPEKGIPLFTRNTHGTWSITERLLAARSIRTEE